TKLPLRLEVFASEPVSPGFQSTKSAARWPDSHFGSTMHPPQCTELEPQAISCARGKRPRRPSSQQCLQAAYILICPFPESGRCFVPPQFPVGGETSAPTCD